jgi:hypothetical protein
MKLQPQHSAIEPRRLNVWTFLANEWPYFLVLILALFGVAYTSVSKTPITAYWIALAPFIGLICVVTRWRDSEGRKERTNLIWTQALHWGAVLVAMHLMFVGDVSRMMNADAGALATLTILALGTFTAGVHIAAWRICVVGIVLALGVPAIAWLEQSALLLVLVVTAVAAIIVPFFWPHKQASAGLALPPGQGSDRFSSNEARGN